MLKDITASYIDIPDTYRLCNVLCELKYNLIYVYMVMIPTVEYIS